MLCIEVRKWNFLKAVEQLRFSSMDLRSAGLSLFYASSQLCLCVGGGRNTGVWDKFPCSASVCLAMHTVNSNFPLLNEKENNVLNVHCWKE